MYVFFHSILGLKHEILSRVLLGCKKSNLGQTPKFHPQMYILQTRRQVPSGLGFHFRIAHCKDHVLQTKLYEHIIPLFFCFSKVIEVYKLPKPGSSPSFSVKENTKIKFISYINNMFPKICINQTFKSYISFNFTYTYTRYRFKIITLRWYLPPENYQISYKTTESFAFQYKRIMMF